MQKKVTKEMGDSKKGSKEERKKGRNEARNKGRKNEKRREGNGRQGRK